MRGPDIIARTLSQETVKDSGGRWWQYHSRSDQHSKIVCWAVLFDMLETSSLLRQHVSSGKVAFGINRQINDFHTGRKKNLDLVVARSSQDPLEATDAFSMVELAARYKMVLEPAEQQALHSLPTSPAGAAGSTVLVALEAKANMTKHVGALPRLYDELTASHATVHGDSQNALALAFVMVNHADEFVSPGRQIPGQPPVYSKHVQPLATERTIAKIREINRRPGPHSGQAGFDALGVLVVDMKNDGSPVQIVTTSPAPSKSDDFYYDRMVTRAAHLYDSAFGSV